MPVAQSMNEILLPVYKSPRRIALSDLLDKLCHRAIGALDELLLEFLKYVLLLLTVYIFRVTGLPKWVNMTSLSRCPPFWIIDSLRSRYALPNQTIIGSDGGLSPVRCQAIVGTNTGLLSTGPLRTYFWNNRNIMNFIVDKYAKRKRCLYNGSHLCLGLSVLI